MSADYYSIDPMKETEQTLLDQIKDEVAEQYGQISWKYAMQNNGSHGISALWEYVCERYYQAKAKASCEATPVSAPSESQEDFAISFAKFCQVDLKGRTFNDLMSEFKATRKPE